MTSVDTPLSSEEYSETLEVTVIEVPVRVLVKGEPVAGLTREDFEIYDQGALQEITAFESQVLARVEGRTSTSEPLETEAAGRRLLVLFDFSSTRRLYLARSLKAVRKMVSSQLHPLDRVAIATYGQYSGLTLLIGFTNQPGELTAALDLVGAILEADRKAQSSIIQELNQLRFGETDRAVGSSMRVFQRLAEELGATAALALVNPVVGVAVPTTGGAEVPGVGEQGGPIGAYKKEVRWVQIAAQKPVDLAPQFAGGPDLSNLRAMSRSLAELFTLLREIKGEKQFVLLSEGFDNRLLSDALGLGYLQEMLRGIRNSGWTVFAVDVKGIPEARQRGYSADSLLYLAKETGGDLQENFNDLSQATARVLRRTGASYVLSFQPQDLEWDGKYHEIEVRLARPLRRAQIFHRPGYYAPEPTRDRLLSEWRVDAAEMVLTAEEVEELQVATLAEPLAIEEGRWRVPVVVNLPWEDLSPERKRSSHKSALEIQAFAVDGNWKVQGFFASGFQLDLGELEEHLGNGGVRFLGELSLPPGDYQLRVLVRNLRSGEVSVSTTRLSVPDASELAPHVGAPFFVDDSGQWLMVTDPSTQSVGSADLLVAGEDRFMPLVSPVLLTGTMASILVLAQTPEGLEIGVEARVVTDDGEPVEVRDIQWHRPLQAGLDGAQWIPATLSTAGLAAGDYRLEVKASWGGASTTQIRTMDFTVED
ncbi:MAG: VWA domain-containing protein [Thermoanaerobaculia bacterium]